MQPLYDRTRDLCQRLGETSQFIPVLWGLWAYYLREQTSSQPKRFRKDASN